MAKSRKAVAIKSLNEKCEKREQLAKVNREKDMGVTHSVAKVVLGSAKTRRAILTKRPTSFWA